MTKTMPFKIKVRCNTCGKIGVDFKDREKALGFGLHHNQTSGHGIKVIVESVILNLMDKE